jgi:hypothetical protein
MATGWALETSPRLYFTKVPVLVLVINTHFSQYYCLSKGNTRPTRYYPLSTNKHLILSEYLLTVLIDTHAIYFSFDRPDESLKYAAILSLLLRIEM